MPKRDPFVINDESKTNSYGFRVLNSGIDLERFNANPVMLDYHIEGNQSVIGKWDNLRIEGSLLLADAIFDEEDEIAKKIQSKVDRGFIKGTSMGLLQGNAKWELIDDIPTLTLTELTEVSIASLPSNANALKLYNSEGKELSIDDIKLSINDVNNYNPKKSTMKQIKLSVAALLVLGLDSEQLTDFKAIQTAVEKLTGDFKENEVKLSAIKVERDTLMSQLSDIQLAKSTALVDEAIKAGKISGDKKEYFLKLAKDDFKTCEGILLGIPGKRKLNVTSTSGTDLDAVKTEEDFEKLSLEDKLSFKDECPEKYNQLFNV